MESVGTIGKWMDLKKLNLAKLNNGQTLGKLTKNDLGNFISKKLTPKIPQGNTT